MVMDFSMGLNPECFLNSLWQPALFQELDVRDAIPFHFVTQVAHGLVVHLLLVPCPKLGLRFGRHSIRIVVLTARHRAFVRLIV